MNMIAISLFLNDVSGSEIIVVMLVILLFFGSKSIPSIAKTMGKALYQIRNATAEIQNEIKNSSAEITKDINLSNILTEKQEELLNYARSGRYMGWFLQNLLLFKRS